jgi:hypothetical protein
MGVKNQGGHLHRVLIFGTGSKPRSRRELITIRQQCYPWPLHARNDDLGRLRYAARNHRARKDYKKR